MITYTGIWVTPATGLVPCPLDIAVHSGRITRYAGALWSSLLAHHVLVAELTWAHLMMSGKPFDHETWAWSILHDAHETFMGEIPRRWKTPERKAQEKEADARLLRAYGLMPEMIDYRLIKQKDERALMAEAIALELPGFRQKYMAENNLSAFPEPDDVELEMMDSLIRSGFYEIEQCTNPDSAAVRGMAHVLALIQDGLLPTALHRFRALLNEVLPEMPA